MERAKSSVGVGINPSDLEKIYSRSRLRVFIAVLSPQHNLNFKCTCCENTGRWCFCSIESKASQNMTGFDGWLFGNPTCKIKANNAFHLARAIWERGWRCIWKRSFVRHVLSDCSRGMAMVRPRAPFSQGGCKPPEPGQETSWSWGSLGHVSCCAGSGSPLPFPCWVGFVGLWPQEGKSLRPRRQIFLAQIQFFSLWGIRECGVCFLRSFDMGK